MTELPETTGIDGSILIVGDMVTIGANARVLYQINRIDWDVTIGDYWATMTQVYRNRTGIARLSELMLITE